MAFPSSNLVTLRPDLAQSLEQFDLAADREGFVGLSVMPVMEVAEAAGNFGIIPLAQLLQTRDTLRAPGSGYSRGTFEFQPATYTTVEHGAEEPVDANQAKMYRNYFSLEQISAMRALDVVLRSHEIRVQAAAAGAGLTGAAAFAWSNEADATPIEDVETAVQLIWTTTGLWPNAMVIPRITYRNLRKTQEVQDLIKYSGHDDPKPGNISVSAIAELFDIPNIFIAGSAKNSANEGQAASIAGMWPTSEVLIYRGDWSEDPRRPCFGRTFHWAEDGSEIGGTMESYPDPKIRGEILRCRNQTDELVLYSDAAYLLTGC